MIQFPCTCGHVFSVDDDQAGGLIQCPACARLNDVPSHSDLANLAEDGTFKMNEPPPPAVDPASAAEMAYVFGKSRVDKEGEEIDLRNTAQDFSTLDGSLTALEPGQTRRHAPQYDPETGELIRSLDFKPDPARDIDPRTVPMATQVGATGVPVIGYATVKPAAAARVPLSGVPRELLRPVNLVVMSCIFIGHVFLNLVVLTVISGIVFIFIGALVLMALLVAHYGNVIDEIGREEADELPRPLRQLNWLDDLWNPFQQVFGSFLLCFLPALLMLLSGAFFRVPLLAALPALVLAAAGAAVFPAVFLTLTTSGSVMNLRPDRVAGVIRAGWRTYPVTVLVFVAVLFAYGPGIFGTLYNLLAGIGINLNVEIGPLGRALVAYPLLIVGIYLAHLFCWRVALTYRAHHAQFPWILQRFEGSKAERAVLSEADRAVMRHEREVRNEMRRTMTRYIR